MDLYGAFDTVMIAINGAFEWFNQLPVEVLTLIVGLTLFAFFARLILAPLFGASFNLRGSDSVRRESDTE